MISSSNTGIDTKINEAIKGVQGAASNTDAATTLNFDRQIGYAQDAGQTSITGNLDSRSGFATNMVALRNLVSTTDKNVNDLESRKQELILQNDASSANKIAELQVQGLQFKQAAMQQVFTNLLGMGNFGLQVGAANRAEEAQSFQEKQAISQIGLQFGVEVKPGDTIDTISSRAAPFASQEQQLKIAQMRSQINENNAQAAKAIADAKATGNAGTANIDVLATALLSPLGGPAILSGIKDAGVQGAVIARAAEIQAKGITANVSTLQSSGMTKNQALANIKANPSYNSNAIVLKQATDAVEAAYKNAPTAKSGSASTPTSNYTTNTPSYLNNNQPIAPSSNFSGAGLHL